MALGTIYTTDPSGDDRKPPYLVQTRTGWQIVVSDSQYPSLGVVIAECVREEAARLLFQDLAEWAPNSWERYLECIHEMQH